MGVHVIEQTEYRRLTLRDYVTDARYVGLVSALQQQAAYLRPLLEGRTLWMVNSTAAGGGVAEMLPRLCGLLRELLVFRQISRYLQLVASLLQPATLASSA